MENGGPVLEREKRQEWVAPPGGNRREEGKEGVGLKIIVRNKKRYIIGPERSLSEVRTSLPRN